jgi:RNA polymerase sigma factor (sigma-70 family)
MQTYGSEDITNQMVLAATRDSAADRERILAAMTSKVRAMVTVRLAPTPAQFHAAEDLAQQSLMALSEALAGLRLPTVEALRSMASVIVARKVADFLRQANPTNRPAAASLDTSVHTGSVFGPLREFLPASSLSPRSKADRAESIRQVMAELGGLEPTHRQVITLAFFDQLAVTEIAEQMGLSRPATSMLLLRAIKAIRRNLTGSSKVDGAHDHET